MLGLKESFGRYKKWLKFGRHKPKRFKKVTKAEDPGPEALNIKRVDQLFGVFENGELIVLCVSEELAKDYVEDLS